MKIAKHVLIGPVIVLVVWLLVSELKLIDAFFLPTPRETITELVKLFVEGTIMKDMLFTLQRMGIAFFIAGVMGIPLGLLLGSSRKLYESFEFVIDFFRSIPATAMFPLFTLVFGIEDRSKIAVTAFAAGLIIIFNTAYGVMHTKKSRTLAVRLMGATRLHIFRFVSFWETLPQIFVGLRTALSLSLVIIIVTEMFIGTYVGLGRRIIDFQYIYNIKGMYAVILLTGILGYLINVIFIMVEKRLLHWTEK